MATEQLVQQCFDDRIVVKLHVYYIILCLHVGTVTFSPGAVRNFEHDIRTSN